MSKYSISDIRFLLTSEKILGNESLKFSNVKTVWEADEESITWIKPSREDKQLLINSTKANIVVVDELIDLRSENLSHKCFIVSENPRLTFAKIIRSLFTSNYPNKIHETCIIHPEAIIDSECYIGPNTYFGKSIIGKGSVIEGNCYIYDNVKIGNNVFIAAGSVIGGEGFGYVKNEEGIWERVPSLGGVIIEDNVNIGANCCIDRGNLGNTHIKFGTKIDNLVQISHNVVIGQNCLIIAKSLIAGSVKIGDHCWIAPSTTIINQISIGSNSVTGIGTVIRRDVGENETWAGNPARKIL